MSAEAVRQDTPHPARGNGHPAVTVLRRRLDGQPAAMANTGTPYTPATLASIKEYESTIKELQNENWQLKLRIFYLTQSVEKFKPEDGFNIKENIEHKVTIEQLQRELVEKDSLLLEARTALQRYAEVEGNMLENTFADLTEEDGQQEGSSDNKIALLRERLSHLETENDSLREMLHQRAAEAEELKALLKRKEHHREGLDSSPHRSGDQTGELSKGLTRDHEKEDLLNQGRAANDKLSTADDEDAATNNNEEKLQSEKEDEIAHKLVGALKQKDDEIANLLDKYRQEQERTRKLEEEREALLAQVHSSKKEANQVLQQVEEENKLLSAELESSMKTMEEYLKTTEQMGTKYQTLQKVNQNLIEDNNSLRSRLESTLPDDALPHSLSSSNIHPQPEKFSHNMSSYSGKPASRTRAMHTGVGDVTSPPPQHGFGTSDDNTSLDRGRREDPCTKKAGTKQNRGTNGAPDRHNLTYLQSRQGSVRDHSSRLSRDGRRRYVEDPHAGERWNASASRSAQKAKEAHKGYGGNESGLRQQHAWAQLAGQIRDRDDFLGLIVASLKKLHKKCCSQSPLDEYLQEGSQLSLDALGSAFGHLPGSKRRRNQGRLSHRGDVSFAFSLQREEDSPSPALHIALPPSPQDFELLSVSLMEQKLLMEESFLLLGSLIKKKDDMHQIERERLKQAVGQYRYEANSLKMQLKHFKEGLSGRASFELPGDESEEEFDDDAANNSARQARKMGQPQEDDVTFIFNKLKSKLQRERHSVASYAKGPNKEEEEGHPESNQQLLWALKEVQAKVERLQESNRVLSRELEEKRSLIEKINSLYKNIPQLLQSPTLPSFHRPSDFAFI